VLTTLWLSGLARRRAARLAGVAAAVALAVGLLASLGAFLAGARAVMTRRAVARVSVDWQVAVTEGADPAAVAATVRTAPGVVAAVDVGYATTTGFEATVGGTTQTTGPGAVLVVPPAYTDAFPGAIRVLAGSATGVLVTQQTAANLHVSPGDRVAIGRSGAPPVAVRVDGVVELPDADSLFQRAGAAAGAQPQAPPDNVVLLPPGGLHAARHQVHVRLDRALPADPARAYGDVTGRARALELRLAGAGLVGDNLAATLDGAREDALYAQLLFLVLGLPGAVVAGLLARTAAAAGSQRRRRDLALLRARGATARTALRFAAAEATVVAVAGSVAGLGLGALGGRLGFGSARFGGTTRDALLWGGIAVAAGVAVTAWTVLLPGRREARAMTVTDIRSGREVPSRVRYGLDAWLLAAGGVAFWLTARTGYHVVLVPEGVPTVSVSYAALAGPLLLWVGGALFVRRVADALLRHRLLGGLVRPVAGPLRGTVLASLSRGRASRTAATTLFALAVVFAGTTSIFYATFRRQAEVDARLTNGADVRVAGAADAAAVARVPGVRRVEPLLHRFAYVGADLQDLYGVDPATVVAATELRDAYFRGGSARGLVRALARRPDGILVSAETVHDFQLQPGDTLNLRLRDATTGRLTPVRFHYLGIAVEFPTAPRDSFLVANASYVAQQTDDPGVDLLLVDTAGVRPADAAARIRAVAGPAATVTDIEHSRALVGSSLTAVDVRGLAKVELSFALVLAVAAAGLVLAVGQAERRADLATVAALGARPRQLGAFVRSEAVVVVVVGTLLGAPAAYGLALALVRVLGGVFDPPPGAPAVPWAYLATVLAVAAGSAVVAAEVAVRAAGRQSGARLRDR
jgi:putative ABC transport system permease protein